MRIAAWYEIKGELPCTLNSIGCKIEGRFHISMMGYSMSIVNHFQSDIDTLSNQPTNGNKLSMQGKTYQSYVNMIGMIVIVFRENNPLGYTLQEERLGIAFASMKIEGNSTTQETKVANES